MYASIKRQTIHRTFSISVLKKFAIAASIILVCTFGLISYDSTPEHKNSASIAVKNKKTALTLNKETVTNYTGKVKQHTLPDGSLVKLKPGSKLEYPKLFISKERRVSLQGEAYFLVSKDPLHPFVVNAGGILTTALGTSFTITAKRGSHSFKVVLHTGKILVKPAEKWPKAKAFQEILLAGSQLVYHQYSARLKVSTTLKRHALADAVPQQLVFTQTPLQEVLAQIETAFGIKIRYEPADVKDLAFTGTINPKKDIDQVLTDIADLNQLKLSRVADGYQISR
ncbi:FecR family protein [Pedobacter sp. P26]|uniref:FecR family protein n=1 Tax=Pedobacter sp. P26 TaxID=3423956 RepID=UPI003D67B0B3